MFECYTELYKDFSQLIINQIRSGTEDMSLAK